MIKKFFTRGYIFLVLAFIYIPIFILVMYSFNEGKTIGAWQSFSLIWYRKLGEIKDVVFNTVTLAVVSSIIATVLGTLGAIGIYYSKGKLGKGVKAASQIPVVNSEVVTACALVMLMMILGLSHRSIIGLYIGHIILSAPFVVLSVMPKLKQMDANLYEAALDLGATPTQALFKVVFPEILPGVFSGFMLAVTLSLDDYIITAFTRDNSFQTLSTYIYGVTAKRGSLPASLRALTTLIVIVMVIVLVIINMRSKKNVVKVKRGVRLR